MGKKRKFKRPVRVTIVMEVEMLENIEKQAAYLGNMEGKPISVSEAIRRGIAAAFPTSKQELFEF